MNDLNDTTQTLDSVVSSDTFTPAKRLRGFALMTLERRKEIGSIGGKAGHAKGTSHKWTKEEAKIAGAKGGSATRKKLLTAK